jgi:hypothetical protein
LAWIDAFNRADVDALAALYHADAINHQVAESPVRIGGADFATLAVTATSKRLPASWTRHPRCSLPARPQDAARESYRPA